MKAHQVLSFNSFSCVVTSATRVQLFGGAFVTTPFQSLLHSVGVSIAHLFEERGVRIVKVLVSGLVALPLLANLLDLRFESFYL